MAAEREPEPSIADAVVGPGHDGQAVLVVRVRHPGGAIDTVTLEADAAQRLLEGCGAETAAELRGRPWRHLLNVIESEPKPSQGRGGS